MNKRKCNNKYWTLRVSGFDEEQRKKLAIIAKSHRQSVGAYIGNLLDEEIRKASKEERA